MELLQVQNLSFAYPKQEQNVLNHINMSLEQGSFSLLMGASGCGKTTLLKLLKAEIAPYGAREGGIYYCGRAQEALDRRSAAAEIGYVCQNVEEQIVTDKVWHELAFGLENIGLDSQTIRRRVAETAGYFGIQDWYHRSTDALSGGQKQLLNLAAVMVMQPKLLLLDEPTSQLDPIAASEFINTLVKLNRELGLTILLAEHRLEEIFPAADRVYVMERGKILADGTPRQVCAGLMEHPMQAALPSAARIWGGLGGGDGSGSSRCPLTVREGREFLRRYRPERCCGQHMAEDSRIASGEGAETPRRTEEEAAYTERQSGPVLEASDLWFRYEKKLPDVLRGLSLCVRKGEIYSIAGGNGAGKTTMLHAFAGLLRPYKGSLRIAGRRMSEYKRNSLYRGVVSLLPQNPRTVFVQNTVRADLEQLASALGAEGDGSGRRLAALAEQFEITSLLDKHPYDLSGGEQQRCALVKCLLSRPRLLLLDEPTKGMDACSKARFAECLYGLKQTGTTILCVTHDIEFAAEVSDRCAMFFDGTVLAEGTPQSFFGGNQFYTTAASRISREISENTVLCRDVIAYCRGERR